ncbi:MAG: type II secretion system F family protein [Candidatus Aenigmarchaeota archaeon]|nr:type II secretion system F family protein [Candidatus Aenigmarchaeota archaeon]
MFKKLVIKLGNWGIEKFPSYFKPLDEVIRLADIRMLLETYVGRMIFFSILTFISIFISIVVSFTYLKISIIITIPAAFMLSTIGALLMLIFFHSYPFQILSKRKASIENNLPFALNHMSAIAAAGVPPFTIFKLLSEVEEYGEISRSAKTIVRNMETFGMDMISAIKQVADHSPSKKFKEFLYSMISIVESGGDMKRFLKSVTQDALFDYRLRREKYLSTLTTYADVYTAVLIAAPLFFIAILSVMSMVGGTIGGMPIVQVMRLGIYAFIPLLNISFIAFVHFTQPAV